MSDNVSIIFSTYAQPIATVLGAVLVLVGAPLFGILVYFKQKEYETIKQRYLDDGIAVIIRQVEYSLDVFQYNWAHSIHLLRTYRDLGVNTPSELYNSGFISIDKPISLEASRHYLLLEIIGDKVFFNVHQLLTAFLHDADNLFKVDLCSAIRLSLEGGKGNISISPPEEIFNAFIQKLNEKHDEGQLYFALLGNLKTIESLFSNKQFSYKMLSKFRNKTEVLKSITDLKRIFNDQLTKFSSQPSEQT